MILLLTVKPAKRFLLLSSTAFVHAFVLQEAYEEFAGSSSCDIQIRSHILSVRREKMSGKSFQ